MADISKIEVNGTEYDVSDTTERVQALKNLTSAQFNKLITFLTGPQEITVHADDFYSYEDSDNSYDENPEIIYRHKSKRTLENGVYLVTHYKNLSYNTGGETAILKIENTYDGSCGKCDIAGFTLYYGNSYAGEDYYMDCTTSSIWGSESGFIFHKLTI